MTPFSLDKCAGVKYISFRLENDMTTERTTWKRTATGNWLSSDGRWLIRGPIFGKPMYWLYDAINHCRFTPTGKHDDSVSFTTLRDAKKYVGIK